MAHDRRRALPVSRGNPVAVRNIVPRPDGRRIHVARMQGQLFVCADACCCGRVQDGYAPVPRDLYHTEWERRGLRNRVHLTIGGCLGPCALANVIMLSVRRRQAWFHSMSTDAAGRGALRLDRGIGPRGGVVAAAAGPRRVTTHRLPPPGKTGPTAKPVDDLHLRSGAPQPKACRVPPPVALNETAASDRLVANMDGPAAVPRKNGELVFEEPWEGRVFGMAVALHDHRFYGWEEFQRQLIAQIAQAETRGETRYYERWLASFERLWENKGLVKTEEPRTATEAFEQLGERARVTTRV